MALAGEEWVASLGTRSSSADSRVLGGALAAAYQQAASYTASHLTEISDAARTSAYLKAVDSLAKMASKAGKKRDRVEALKSARQQWELCVDAFNVLVF